MEKIDYRFEVKRYNGVPTLFICDKPVHGWFTGDTSGMKFEKELIKCFPDHLYSLRIPSPEFNTLSLEKDIKKLLQKDKDAIILFHFRTDRMPQWWIEKYGDELIVYDDGGKKASQCGPEKMENPSISSEIWKQYVCDSIRKYTRYLKENYPERFSGYYFAWGICGEWNYYGETDMNDWRCPDFSPAMIRKFRSWLREKYGNSIKLLRESWNDATIDFESAEIPQRIKRLSSELGSFRDPLRNSDVTDYYQFVSDIAADTFIDFCKTAKEQSSNTIICGGGYGGLMDINVCSYLYFGLTTSGGIKKVLNSPYVDFYSTPYSYYSREIGVGDCSYMCITESWKLHNKIRLGDNDTRTSLAEPFHKPFGRPDTIRDSIEILKRDFGQHLIRTSGGFWLAQWLDHPQLIKTISKLNKIGQLSMKYDRSSADGIAMIVDVDSLFYQKMANILMYKLLYEQRMNEFGRIGTPWHLYLHDDLAINDMPDYRVYVFLNTFYLTDSERKTIKEKVCRNNNTVVWMHAPGFQNEKGFSMDAIEDLTGIRVRYEDVSANSEIKIINFFHPLTNNIIPDSRDSFLGVRKMFEWSGTPSHGHMDHTGVVEPVFYADDPHAMVFGKIISINKPGFVMKDMGEWKSIYISAPMLTAKILRNICKFSGVHIYLDTDDLLYANRHFVVVHTKTKGEKTINLPVEANVYEAFENRCIGKSIKRFTEFIPARCTRIYFLEY
ncbi:MAG: Beta-galactosidase [candidate division TA06 bacterium ADurb.Bin131]|uniref:Beta-galactosidase n=1 Tax=candidate division TA06 bacterium ADurb.Bin131 TaxID=1852827 RepID=A0A1V6C909_UNCT6|nr:MAG: Beta-galactosidase [candidate division TA06 bacterium ADurb.Bin131]HRV05081.1 beta-galactosidase [Candidatus Ratteibacteria bacterium]